MSITRIERQLGIQLPTKYLAAIEKLGKLDDPHKLLRMITDPSRLLEINLAIRKTPKKHVKSPAKLAANWPSNYFVIADAGVLCFIDILEKNPEVQYIRDKQLVAKDHLTPDSFKNVTAFAKSCEDSFKLRMKALGRAEVAAMERQKAAKRPTKKVECPDLVAEANKLAKQCLLLGPSGTKLIGIQGGAAIGCPPKKAIEHLLTISCSALPLNPRSLTGIMSIYKVDQKEMFKAVLDPKGRLPSRTSGKRLYGTKHLCLPSFGVLVHKGSPITKRWFESLRVAGRDAESWATAKEGGDYPELDRYLAAFRASHPFYRFQPGEYVAMLGGWSLNYPGGSDWYATMNRQLLLATLQGEPWLEVIDGGKSPKVVWHVT